MTSGAEFLVESMRAHGITHAAGLCGHGNIGLLDALRTCAEISTISVHHEQAAGHIADAYFRVARRPMATFTSCGPGSTNLPVALASAYYDRSAVLAVTGSVPTTQFGKGAFQETYRPAPGSFAQVLAPYVKAGYQPTTPDMLCRYTGYALDQVMADPPAPVHLDVPLDLFAAQDETFGQAPGATVTHSCVRPAAEAVQAVAEYLRAARRPLLLVGSGFTPGDETSLLELAAALGCHVATTPPGKGSVTESGEWCIGPLGRNGSAAANAAARQADVILALNVDFDDRTSSSWLPGATFDYRSCALLHVHERVDMIGRAYRPAVGVVASPGLFVRDLLSWPGLATAADDSWTSEVRQWRAAGDGLGDGGKVQEPGTLDPREVISALRASVPDDTIVLSDVGVHHNWMIQRWQTRQAGTFLHSWGFGSMGFGVAGVLGAKLASPDRPALAVCGDGGFLMNAHAVATAVQAGLPAVWVVWDNHGFVSIRDLQLAFFGGQEFMTSFEGQDSEFVRFDFAALARSLGAHAVSVTDPEQLSHEAKLAVASSAPTVLHVPVARETRPLGTGGWALPPLDPSWPAVRLDLGQ